MRLCQWLGCASARFIHLVQVQVGSDAKWTLCICATKAFVAVLLAVVAGRILNKKPPER